MEKRPASTLAASFILNDRRYRGPRRWRYLPVAAVLALLTAACAGDNGSPAPTAEPTAEQTSEPTARPTAESPGGTAQDWATCESTEAGYSVDYPAGWETNSGDVLPPCSLFDPESAETEAGTEISTDIAVAITVQPVSLEEIRSGSSLGQTTLEEREETVNGRAAVRSEQESTGEGLYPPGLVSTQWLVSADGETISASTYDSGEMPYGEKQDILDEMIASLDLLEGD